jgi:glucokinase
MTSRQRVLGIDVGGTKILAGVVTADGSVERYRETVTPVASQAALLDALEEAARALLDDAIGAVGFGVPSTVDQATGRVEGSVNIPLQDLDFRDEMARRLGLPVRVANDANAATLAEFAAGAGVGARTMVMLTLGTGCGGGAVLDGKLYEGWAEFGHLVVDADGLPCQGTCHGRGHLEAYVTGLAATQLAREALGPAADSYRLVRLANEGDVRAREILRGIGRRLGDGVGALANCFGAELAVIGGGFGRAAFAWLHESALERARAQALRPLDARLRIVPARLGTTAGVVGAGLVGLAALGAEA